MKKLIAIVLAGCTLVISHGFQNLAAADDEVPLRKLAGTYANTAQGSAFLCFVNAPPYPLAACGSTGSIGVPIAILQVGAITYDTKGNSCATLTETDNDLPVGASPPGVFVFRVAGKIASYDPTTGTGDTSFTQYVGGQCQGASFDSTGATAINTGTYHFAVSNNGKRIDGVLTSVINPVGAIGGFSIPFTFLRQ